MQKQKQIYTARIQILDIQNMELFDWQDYFYYGIQMAADILVH